MVNTESEDDDAGKIFVGGLSWETTQEKLQEYFSQYGEVSDSVVMMNNETGKSRGFGFITFKDAACVAKVLSSGPHELDNRTIDPKVCSSSKDGHQGKKSGQNPKIFLGGLPPSTTETDIRSFFSRYGTVVEVVLMYDQEKKKSRGFGFLSFETEDSCKQVCAEHFVKINGKKIECKHAEPRAAQKRLNQGAGPSGQQWGPPGSQQWGPQGGQQWGPPPGQQWGPPAGGWGNQSGNAQGGSGPNMGPGPNNAPMMGPGYQGGWGPGPYGGPGPWGPQPGYGPGFGWGYGPGFGPPGPGYGYGYGYGYGGPMGGPGPNPPAPGTENFQGSGSGSNSNNNQPPNNNNNNVGTSNNNSNNPPASGNNSSNQQSSPGNQSGPSPPAQAMVVGQTTSVVQVTFHKETLVATKEIAKTTDQGIIHIAVKP